MSETLSITYLTSYDPFTAITGADINTRVLATEMAHRGHEVTVIHSYVGKRQLVPRENLQCLGVSNVAIPVVAGWTASRGIRVAFQEKTHARKQDVLDVRGGALGLVLRGVGSRCIARVFHPVDLSLEEWRALPFKSGLTLAVRYFALAYGERAAVNHADWVVLETECGGKAFSKVYPQASRKWTAVPSALPRSWEPWSDGSYDPLHFVFIGAGSRRDTELFLRALKVLSDERLPVQATILREPRDHIRQIASSLNLKVNFLGPVAELELRRIFARSCAFVLPSLREAYCRSVVESAYHGTPSVVSDLPTVREFVDDGKNGIVVLSWDASAWADSMKSLIQNSDLRARLGIAARTKAIEHYSSAIVGNLIESGYRDCLDRIVEGS